MKNMLKDVMILFLITLIAGGILGGVYYITKAPIAEQERLAKLEAYQQVFGQADHFSEYKDFDSEKAQILLDDAGYTDQEINEVMLAQDTNDETLGYILTVTTKSGYGGDIIFSMGITNEGILNGISLLTINETPGLGMKAEEILVPQFQNKDVDLFSYTKSGSVTDSQIDAISGATITTSAITDGVNAGLKYFQELEGGAE